MAFSGLAGCIPNSPRETGMVTKVIDGDTIEVVIREVSHTVRYIGMDTPEMQGEVYALEATQLNKNLVEGKFVTLVKDVSETDQYDRLLRYVVIGDLFINYELVKQGLAYAKDYPPDTACSQVLHSAQAEAQAAGLMLWSPALTAYQTASAVPPIFTPVTGPGSGGAPCSCTGPDLDCKDFSSRAAAQACWDYCRQQGISNPHNLDGNDQDGRVCETMQ
jgi:endonuclease YncB( thermonuclease family)